MPHQTLHVTRHAKMPGFIINSVGYEMSGPVFDNDYAMMYSFTLLSCVDLKLISKFKIVYHGIKNM